MTDPIAAPGRTSRHFLSHLPIAAAAALCLPAPADAGVASEVRLNEFMAANSTTVVPNAVAGTFDDWIELHNSSASPIDLGGWHLTDNAGTLTKFTLPAGTVVAADGYLVVFASTEPSPDANGNLHTGFALAAGGEYVALVRPDLTIAGEFGPGGSDYPPQESDISYGLRPSDLGSVYFATPTPGGPNSTTGFLRVAETTFSAKRGFYTAAFNLTLSTTTSGATIYYTLDSAPPLSTTGTPTATATAFTSPINISSTTVVRAAAVRDGFEPSNIGTQSYIFPSAVATQTRPANYPTSWGSEPSADYDVDPSVSLSAQDSQRFLDGLRSIPTLSVSTSVAALFGPAGIYSRTTSKIPPSDDPFMPPHPLEPAVSAEYFLPASSGDGANAEDGFQIDCGLRIQGGASRNPSSSIKHSLSLRFRGFYGEGKLRHDLFGAPAVEEFEAIHLRAMYNNSWIHRDAGQRARATMIRDQWMRDSMIAMGNADGGHGSYVHLYLNGLYWGVYNIHERFENDHYANYNGGDADGIIGYNPGSSSHTATEQAAFNAMRTVVQSGTWPEIEAVLDVDNYIDYYIMQHFGHNDDLKTDGNWRAVGGGPSNAPWRFYCWDSERILENVNNTNNLAVNQDGAQLIDHLDNHPEFRLRFSDRAYRHLHHGGALTNLPNRDRFLNYVTFLDEAIVGESARWGDDRPGGSGPSGDYTRAHNWLPAIYGPIGTTPSGGVLGNWFPATGSNRTNIMIAAWKSQAWPGTGVTKLPSVDPPQFAVNGSPQHGGEIPPGGTLTLTGGVGILYYTTDGSDPRADDGSPHPSAIHYSGFPVSLADSGLIRTRWFNGGNWSALNQATFFVEALATAADLRITEINYHPHDPTLQEIAAGGPETPDFEFVELLNVGADTVNLAGVRFSQGIRFTFGLYALAPGARVVINEDQAAFEARYGPGLPVADGDWDGALDNSGESLTLLSASGAVIHSFAYDDSGPWPGRADGDGSTLEVIDTEGDYADATNWRSSSEFGGTPGAAGSGPDSRASVNEVLTHTDPPLSDSIEIANTSGAPLDISGWFLSDTKSNYRKFRIPEGTTIPQDGYLVFDEDDFAPSTTRPISSYSGTASAPPTTVTSNSHGLATGDVITISGYSGFGAYNGTFQVTATGTHTFTIPTAFLDNAGTKGEWVHGEPFRLSSSKGEDVWLLEAGAGGELLTFVDHVGFPAALNGESFGRWPNLTGDLYPMLSRTFGAANSGPRIGPLVISEIHYHPTGTPETSLEFVEIFNPTGTTENLANWTLRGSADLNFPATSLAPGDIVVVVGFDPANPTALDAFQAAYGVDYPVTYLGPWDAGDALANAPGGTVRLRRADDPDPQDPTFFPQVIEDEVKYRTALPWPTSADGGGSSLNRVGTTSFGSFSTSWSTGAPSPGRASLDLPTWALITGGDLTPGADTDLDGVPDRVEYALGLNPTVPDSDQLPMVTYDGTNITLTFPRDLLRSDVSLAGETSPNLIDWSPIADVLVSESGGLQMRAITIPAESDHAFIRLRAE
ncbi:hypothetical protein BH23VER1_BH23VER1_14000 [soil metagenome]